VNAAQHVMKVDRVRFARIRSPQDNDAGALDLLVRARSAACPEDRRQTDDARSVSSSIAAVDVVAADDRASELLSDIVHLVGRFRTAEHPVRVRSVSPARIVDRRCGTVERLLPGCAAKLAAIAYERVRQSNVLFAHDL
jgi:hypothetical protein